MRTLAVIGLCALVLGCTPPKPAEHKMDPPVSMNQFYTHTSPQQEGIMLHNDRPLLIKQIDTKTYEIPGYIVDFNCDTTEGCPISEIELIIDPYEQIHIMNEAAQKNVKGTFRFWGPAPPAWRDKLFEDIQRLNYIKEHRYWA